MMSSLSEDLLDSNLTAKLNIDQKLVARVEKNVKYSFKNKELLIEALTHKSFCAGDNKNLRPNERLEFLGDAILGAVIAEQLMNMYKKDNEGLLSKKRASVINQEVLSNKAKAMFIDEVLIMGPGERNQGSNQQPRILASAFEAIIGAIYLESDFGTVQKWITAEFDADISKIKPDLEYEKDYKTRLQELVMKHKMSRPEYKLISSMGPSHDPEFLVAVLIDGEEKIRAKGKSKKNAEQKAAELCLNDFLKLEKKTDSKNESGKKGK